jgi:hypothetical protein
MFPAGQVLRVESGFWILDDAPEGRQIWDSFLVGWNPFGFVPGYWLLVLIERNLAPDMGEPDGRARSDN